MKTKKFWSVDELRTTYLDYFKQHDHTVVASDSLVPTGDPTLLFTGAGMNQFKDYFLGLKKDLKRATSSQKCLRTADLDRVGQTPYHHSFFEMLGNFSFGDYFKEEAIAWAWEFMTQVLGNEKDKLWVSVYEKDEEAYQIWKKKIGLSDSVIRRMGPEDNFWPSNAPQDGPNGPCGPCSEIYFVQADGTSAEVWNLVFTQFDRRGVNQLADLPSKNIDTGMGLERLACLMQGKKSNFEIDIFEPLVNFVENRLKSESHFSSSVIEIARKNVYAACDHTRAVSFCIADGVAPSNEGRGYVVRKLIRQAVWKLWRENLKQPKLYEMVPSIVQVMSKSYPEIASSQKLISHTLQAEEERFLVTLEDGIRRTREHLKIVQPGEVLDPQIIFRLYDTYGFPFELIQELASTEGVRVDNEKFEKLLENQRVQSRGISKISASIFSATELDKKIASLTKTEFTGYQSLQNEAHILSLFDGEKEVPSLSGPCEGFMITNRTPFYAESGGQVGDQGRIKKNQDLVAQILDTTKKHDIFIHQVRLEKNQTLKTGENIVLIVDQDTRKRTMKNHTATHLLHAALRQVLGNHVRQAGSLVHPDRLRFDFTHFKALSPDEIKKIEELVNQQIQAKTQVSKEEKSYDEAKKEGAIAFFGEKYGERVRTITVSNFSKELCGGTHVDNTSQIGQFKIVSESSIASGTRRIEALTGDAVETWMSDQKQKEENRKQSEQQKKIAQDTQKQKLDQITDLQLIKKLIEQSKHLPLKNGVDVRVIEARFDNVNSEALKNVFDALKKQSPNMVAVLCSTTEDNKLNIVLGVSGVIADHPKMSAKDLLNEKVGPLFNIKGGGRKDLAQGGGAGMKVTDEQLKKTREVIEKFILSLGL